jgi:hypothetical protein
MTEQMLRKQNRMRFDDSLMENPECESDEWSPSPQQEEISRRHKIMFRIYRSSPKTLFDRFHESQGASAQNFHWTKLHRTLANYFSESKPPTFHATINGAQLDFPTIEAKFDALAQDWIKHTKGRSVTEFNHFSHSQIIGMGPAVIPILLRRLQCGESDWIMALKTITGVKVTTSEMRGNVKAIIEAWISWGKANGLWQELL